MTKSEKTHEEAQAERIGKILDQQSSPMTVKMEGNFPVDLYQVEDLDQETGQLTLKRISRQMRFLNSAGQEIPDPRPMSPALGRKPEMHIRDYIKTLVHSERMQQELEASGHETFEEANDFEVGDDYFPDSQYENDLDPSLAELVREGTASLSAKARAAEKADAKRKADARQERTDALTRSPPPEPSKKARRAVDPALKPDEGLPDESGLDD